MFSVQFFIDDRGIYTNTALFFAVKYLSNSELINDDQYLLSGS